jgi:hypothetical protein
MWDGRTDNKPYWICMYKTGIVPPVTRRRNCWAYKRSRHLLYTACQLISPNVIINKIQIHRETVLACWIYAYFNAIVCMCSRLAMDDGWKYHPKHVEQFPDINKLCNVASCWIYEYIGILLGANPLLHISRIRVNKIHIHRETVLACWIYAYFNAIVCMCSRLTMDDQHVY